MPCPVRSAFVSLFGLAFLATTTTSACRPTLDSPGEPGTGGTAATGSGGQAATGTGGAATGSGGSPAGSGGTAATGSGGQGGGSGGAGSGGTPGDAAVDRTGGGTGGNGTADAAADRAGDRTGGTGGAAVDGGPLTGPGRVTIEKNGATFTLMRDGQPYFIKGFDGQARMDLAQQAGANSTRSYNSSGAMALLNSAQARGMTVLMGIDLSKDPAQYADETYKASKRAEITTLTAQIKNHPALLMWALGNEINLGADVQAAWTFVNELTQLLHTQDPDHPVATVIAGANVTALNHIAAWTPLIDLVGINSYAAVVGVDSTIRGSNFKGPYIVPEWGPTGHWESPNTSWGMPIEETSGAKARVYQQRYESFAAHRDRCLGSYVFLWAQKEERTPTWYGMFLETLAALGVAQESCPTVDVMAFEWSGAWPANRAPDLTALTIDGKKATDSITLTTSQVVTAQVTVTDPEGDALKYVWEVLEDTDLLSGGSPTRPNRVGAVQTGTTATLTLTAPTTPGLYRLYVYVLDGKGHAGTANVPFRI